MIQTHDTRKIRVGDRVTFLEPEGNSYYEITSLDDKIKATFWINGEETGRDITLHVNGGETFTILNRDPDYDTVSDIRKGDKFTFIPSTKSFYTALSDWTYGEGVRTHFTDSMNKFYPFEDVTASYSNPNDHVTILKEKNNTVNNDQDANGAKLSVAENYTLKARFNYTNADGETRDRRLVVDFYDGEVFSGQSYDEYGASEGYRQFRLDRINGAVTIR